MGLRNIESTLPPGFRFFPSDEELVCHYLYKKVTNERTSEGTMVEVDLHTREPWELPEVAKLSANEWYFFSFRDRKYATGSRTNRATKSGYWKATGKDRIINDPRTRSMVGMRKTLVFYRGRAPNGIKSGWVMHEFRLETPHSPPKEDWVLCRVFQKRKGEETEQDNGGYSSPTLRSSPPPLMDQPMPDGCYEQMDSSFPSSVQLHQDFQDSSSSPFLNLALLQCNFIDFPKDIGGASMVGMSSSRGDQDDQCGFFMDCGFEERDIGEEVGGMARIGDGRYQGQGISDKFYF